MATIVGTAGWSIARDAAEHFPAEGSSLSRYAARFAGAEVNSSFHRPHRLSTWQRWHDSVPDGFRFSVKLPKTVTHVHKLADCADALDPFLAEVAGLGHKLAVLLVQLPPKMAFDEAVAGTFFRGLAGRTAARIVCEPRNLSWFTPDAEAMLEALEVARVAADPAICAGAAAPGGWRGLQYWRLHGSPVVYRSSYHDRIDEYARQLAGGAGDKWCIFDNTASSAATGDALALTAALRELGGR